MHFYRALTRFRLVQSTFKEKLHKHSIPPHPTLPARHTRNPADESFSFLQRALFCIDFYFVFTFCEIRTNLFSHVRLAAGIYAACLCGSRTAIIHIIHKIHKKRARQYSMNKNDITTNTHWIYMYLCIIIRSKLHENDTKSPNHYQKRTRALRTLHANKG